MSQIPKPTLALLLIFAITLVLANHASAGREIPGGPSTTDRKQPQFLIGHDGSYLVPGIGRFMFPKKGHGYNPFTYNPVTGRNTGINHPIIGGDSSAGAGHTQIPGGDDTFFPSPGAGIPIPGIGGTYPSPASP